MKRVNREIINQDNPYLILLRKRIEEVSNWEDSMTNKIGHLMEYLNLSRNNIRKIWAYDNDKTHIRELDKLVKKACIEDIETWNEYISSQPVEFFGDDQLRNAEEELKSGSEITYGLFPFRYVVVEYLGDCLFVINKYQGNGTDITGKKVDARWFEITIDYAVYGNTKDIITMTQNSKYLTLTAVLGNQRTNIDL